MFFFSFHSLHHCWLANQKQVHWQSVKIQTGTLAISEDPDRYTGNQWRSRQVHWQSVKIQTGTLAISEDPDRYIGNQWRSRQVHWQSVKIQTGTLAISEDPDWYTGNQWRSRQVHWQSVKIQTGTLEISEDPDEMPQHVTFNQVLHSLLCQQLWSCWDGQFTLPHFFLSKLDQVVNQYLLHTLSLVTDNNPF